MSQNCKMQQYFYKNILHIKVFWKKKSKPINFRMRIIYSSRNIGKWPTEKYLRHINTILMDIELNTLSANVHPSTQACVIFSHVPMHQHYGVHLYMKSCFTLVHAMLRKYNSWCLLTSFFNMNVIFDRI